MRRERNNYYANSAKVAELIGKLESKTSVLNVGSIKWIGYVWQLNVDQDVGSSKRLGDSKGGVGFCRDSVIRI